MHYTANELIAIEQSINRLSGAPVFDSAIRADLKAASHILAVLRSAAMCLKNRDLTNEQALADIGANLFAITPKPDPDADKAAEALRALCDDLDQLEGSGPFVIGPEFCQVNRERARRLLAVEPDSIY